jgi:hypothetical protein
MRTMRAMAWGVVLGMAAMAWAGEAAKEAEKAPAPAGPIVHSVYFWLKDEAKPEDVETLIRDCKELGTLDCVQRLEVGTPLPGGRGSVDGGYAVGLVVLFADKAAYDAYLPHPKHQGLVTKHKGLWKKVVVYDFVKQ